MAVLVKKCTFLNESLLHNIVTVCENHPRKVVRRLLPYLSMQKWLVGDVPFYVKIWPKLTHPFENTDFQAVFASSASAITSSEKSSFNTNRKSTMRFTMNLR